MSRRSLEMLQRITGQPIDDLIRVSSQYPFALSPFLTRRVADGSYSIAALKQFLPDVRELEVRAGFGVDPTGEGTLHPERAVLQTYDNRLALILTQRCLVYCRFCFRKSFVGLEENDVTEDELEGALSYLAAHPEVEDVLLSGGDPLAIPNGRLIAFLERVLALGHVKTVRIHSRALSAHPDRIDSELVDYLSRHDCFWYYAHMNHPDDIDHSAVTAAIRRLLGARVPVLNQCVLLSGVNDDVNTMTRLMKLCYERKVIPYNLYLLDRVAGTAHFDVPVATVAEIYRALAELPGPAQPVLVYVDATSRKHRAVYDSPEQLSTFLSQRG